VKGTVLALAFALLVACGGPKARIKESQELFDTYPPETQALIKSGQIAKGFDQTQTYMALGKPEKKEANGEQETWVYTVGVKRTLKHEKGAVQYENEQLKYERAMEEYRRVKAEGGLAVEPAKPDPFIYEHQHRTRVKCEVVFVDGRVAGWRDPVDEYLDEWH
jgi:hypothetical protein